MSKAYIMSDIKPLERAFSSAFGEYIKLVISREFGIKDYWSYDVSTTLNNMKEYMDSERIKLKSKSNREKMLKEAMREASTFQDQVLSAKNDLMKHFPKIWKKIKLLNIDSEKMFEKMIDEFLPEYSHLLSMDMIERRNKEKNCIKHRKLMPHSKKFLEIMESAYPEIDIRIITHSKPTLVYWISPNGDIIDAKDAHVENPPDGDRSILSDKIHKGYIRGRAAFIGDILYIVVYGENNGQISKRQLIILRKSYLKMLKYLVDVKGLTHSQVDTVKFIDEQGIDPGNIE